VPLHNTVAGTFVSDLGSDWFAEGYSENMFTHLSSITEAANFSIKFREAPKIYFQNSLESYEDLF
jgi:hypothetical protein